MPIIRIDAGKEKLIKTSGKYLSIINSTGSFSIESPQFGSVLGELGRQLELDDVREVLFCNTSNQPLNVEYEVANIKVHISGKGGSVSIENLPAVQEVRFSESFEQSVNVGNFPTQFNVGNFPTQFNVGNFPAQFNVGNLPAVQRVAIESGFPAAFEVSNLPVVQKVAIESGFPAAFEVSNFPSEFSVKSGGEYQPLAPADFTNSSAVDITENTERLTLVIMAGEHNTGLIWVGGDKMGIPLSAGREFNLGSGSALTLYAEHTTDTCYLAEVTK